MCDVAKQSGGRSASLAKAVICLRMRAYTLASIFAVAIKMPFEQCDPNITAKCKMLAPFFLHLVDIFCNNAKNRLPDIFAAF